MPGKFCFRHGSGFDREYRTKSDEVAEQRMIMASCSSGGSLLEHTDGMGRNEHSMTHKVMTRRGIHDDDDHVEFLRFLYISQLIAVGG